MHRQLLSSDGVSQSNLLSKLVMIADLYDCVLYSTAWREESYSLGYRNGRTQHSQREVGIDTREGGRGGTEGGREGGGRGGEKGEVGMVKDWGWYSGVEISQNYHLSAG